MKIKDLTSKETKTIIDVLEESAKNDRESAKQLLDNAQKSRNTREIHSNIKQAGNLYETCNEIDEIVDRLKRAHAKHRSNNMMWAMVVVDRPNITIYDLTSDEVQSILSVLDEKAESHREKADELAEDLNEVYQETDELVKKSTELAEHAQALQAIEALRDKIDKQHDEQNESPAFSISASITECPCPICFPHPFRPFQ